MRYMRWSYVDLLTCPDDYVEVIAAQATKEAREQKQANAKAKRR